MDSKRQGPARDPSVPMTGKHREWSLPLRWLGFLGGWWLLQLVLLGAGFLAIDRLLPQLEHERVAATGEILRTAIEQPAAVLQPLSPPPPRFNVPRFEIQAQAILGHDTNLRSIVWRDEPNGKVLAQVGVREEDASNSVTIAMNDGGTLTLSVDMAQAHVGAWNHLRRFALIAGTIPLLHLALGICLKRRIGRTRPSLWWTVNGLTGVITSALLIGAVLTLALAGTSKRVEIYDHSLALMVAETLDRPRTDPRQLNRLLAEYQDRDSSIEGIILVGESSHFFPGSHNVLSGKQVDMAQGGAIRILRPWSAFDWSPALSHGLRNLGVLILAMALLCAVLGGNAPGFRAPLAALRSRIGPEAATTILEAIRPLYFLAVLAENLCAPFLPHILQESVAAAHWPPTVMSAVFMAYFVAFTSVLVPAGWLSNRWGPAGLVRGGLVLLSVGLVFPFLSLDASAMLASRIAMGAGQGVLLIGVQSLILSATAAGGRTTGTGIIVFGFNGGMVAGNAFGSLLVESLGAATVFALAASLTASLAGLAWLTLPKNENVAPQPMKPERRRLDLAGFQCLADSQFLAATLWIGIPTKAVLTGVVLFAFPLILGHRGYGLEEIGQIAMLYAVGVLTASSVVSRLADRKSGRTGQILTIGSLVSAMAMAGIPLADHVPGGAWEETSILALCILILGMAHGFINAPVVTHIADLPIAQRLGAIRVAANYRLIERFGHICGPLVVERILSVCAVPGNNSGDGAALTWIGAAIAGGAVLFALRGAIVRRRIETQDAARAV